jgi:L-aminopeptidase/D-esterase-like protein
VPGIGVGYATDAVGKTGCTVVLATERSVVVG